MSAPRSTRLHTVRLQDAPTQPWRNGGGTTRELLAWPSDAQAGAWQVRVSVADITRDGPFSPFPGVHRAFAVLEGAGVELDFAATANRSPAGLHAAPHEAGAGVRCLAAGEDAITFDGAQAPGCRLIAGLTRDLNLMVRSHVGQARMTWATPGQSAVSQGPWRGLYTHGGARLDTAAGPVALPAATLAWSDAEPAAAWRLVEGHHCWWLDLTVTLGDTSR